MIFIIFHVVSSFPIETVKTLGDSSDDYDAAVTKVKTDKETWDNHKGNLVKSKN